VRWDTTMTSDKHWPLLIPALLVIFWLGGRALTTNAIWLDETWSLYNAGGAQYGPLSPVEIIQRVSTQDPRNAALVYHLLLAGWGALVGWSAFAVRASSLLCGALALAWTYRLGRVMLSPLAGLSAAILMGASVLFVYFQHELRTYMLATACVPFTLWGYWQIAHSARPGRWSQAGFLLGLLGLLYTHYLAAVIIPGIGLYHLLFVPKTRRWWRSVILMALAGLLFLPWLGTLVAGMQLNAGEAADLRKQALTPSGLLERLVTLFSSGAPGLLAIAVGLALAAGRQKRADVFAPWLFAGVGVVGVLLANALFYILVPGRERYLLMIWPLLALVVGMGIAYLARIRLRALAYLVLLTWLVLGARANLDGALTQAIDGANALPWDTLARALARDAQPGDAVAVHITTYNWVLEIQTADYHLHGLSVRFALLQSLPDADFAAAARQFVGEAGQVWLGLDKRLPASTRLDEFAGALSGQYAPCGTVFDLPRLRLERYKRLPASAFDPATAVLRFDDGVSLTYADLTPPGTGGALNVLLAWALSDHTPRGTYSAALHVVDAADRLVAQADYGLPDSAIACRQTTIPLDLLPPGDYRLLVIVYKWAGGARLNGSVVATGARGDRLPLGQFTLR
jgi:hypothetical protein